MKKTLLVAAFALAGSFAFAQKPSAGNKTAEVNLNFQTGTAPIGYNLPAELRLRYFLADNSAVRIRFGIGSNSAKSSVTNGTNTADITDKSGLGLTITPGNIVVDDTYKSTAGSTFGLTLGLMMGADYYIADGVFIGGEFGLGLFGMTSTGEGETVVKMGATTTTTKTTKSSTSELFGVTTGGVRLGFVF